MTKRESRLVTRSDELASDEVRTGIVYPFDVLQDMRNERWLVVGLSVLLLGAVAWPGEAGAQAADESILVEDFEGYAAGVPPYHGKRPYKKSRSVLDLPRVLDRDDDSKDWPGRPRSIKYTYSSTLPVGTTASYGALRVIVVASAADGLGDWIRIERDVVADYRRVFRRDPPNLPVFITLWGDSDNTGGVSDVYFDDIALLPARY